MQAFGTKAHKLTEWIGDIPDTQLVIIADPGNGKLFRSTFGQMKADIILAFGEISFLDPIVEVLQVVDLPQPGAIKTLYVITGPGPDENKQFRWGGSMYIEFPRGSGDVAGEAIIRANADAQLQQNIDNLEANREAAELVLQTAISQETSLRGQAYLLLDQKIFQEAQTRGQNDNTLFAAITSEGQIRAAADLALAVRIAILEGAGPGSVIWGGLTGNILDQADLIAYIGLEVAPGDDAYTWGNHAGAGYLTASSSLAWGNLSGVPDITLMGNAFNGADQLVQLTAAGKLPALDGSLLTNLPGGSSLPPITGNAGKFLTNNGTTASWAAVTGWLTGGNFETDPAIHFIGTLDNRDLVFKTNGIECARLGTDKLFKFDKAQFGGVSGSIFQGGGTPELKNMSSTGMIFKDNGNRIYLTGTNFADVGPHLGASFFNASFLLGKVMKMEHLPAATQIMRLSANSYAGHLVPYFDIVALGYAGSKNQDIRIYTTNTTSGTFGNIILAHNGTTATGSVGIGTNTPASSAIIDVSSSTKGSLPCPRMTTTLMNAITPLVEGLEVYNTTIKKKCFYNGSAWEQLNSTLV